MKAWWYFSFFSFLLFFINTTIYAQDTTALKTTESDSITVTNKAVHSPKKAAYLSIMPGLGQVYNKKYWKVPVIYAALGTTAYLWVDNNKQYSMYRDAYIGRIDEDTTNNMIMPEYTTEDLRQLKNYYWKYRDMSVLIFVGIWALNILDATVDAHLYSFDISDDLSMRVLPAMSMPLGYGKSPAYGISIAFKF